MAIQLYDDGYHQIIGFYDLVSDEGVQSNQFLIINGSQAAFLDPGGEVIFNDLLMCAHKYLSGKMIKYVIASHQDPDILSVIKKWLSAYNCQIIIPSIWERFIVHCTLLEQLDKRILGIPDQGMNLRLGQVTLKALPAHFLHSEGNFHFYDPVSKILFSGDVGASPFLRFSDKVEQPIEDFEQYIPNIDSFHRRYMANNKVCRYWVNMVRHLDIEWIVPQHGKSIQGKAMIARFLTWFEQLECGTDLITQGHYTVPK